METDTELVTHIKGVVRQIEHRMRDPELDDNLYEKWRKQRKALLLALNDKDPFKIRRCRDG